MARLNRVGPEQPERSDPRITAADYKRHYPTADEEAMEAGMRVTRTSLVEIASLMRFFASLGFDLSVPRHSVLRILRFAGANPKTLNDVRAELAVTSGAVTSLIDGLEQEGLVTRIPHPIDRRATFVELTEKGQLLADSTLSLIPTFFENIFRGFSTEEKRLLNELLERLQENAQSIYVE